MPYTLRLGPLQVLDLSNNAFISDAGIAALAGLRQLGWLNLSGSNQVRGGLGFKGLMV